MCRARDVAFSGVDLSWAAEITHTDIRLQDEFMVRNAQSLPALIGWPPDPTIEVNLESGVSYSPVAEPVEPDLVYST